MMYKDLEEEKSPIAHDTFIKHFNFDKSGWVETQDQCIINAMEEYALVKTRELQEKNHSLEQQLEDRNISISAVEFCSNLEMKLSARDLEIVALKDALFMRNQMIQSLDKTIDEKIRTENLLIEHQEFSQWLEEQMDNMTTEQVNSFLPNLYNKTFKLNHD